MNETRRFQDSVVAAIMQLPEFKEIEILTGDAKDVSLALPSIARAAFIAAQFTVNPRPMLVVAESSEAADLMTNALSAFFETEKVLIFPERDDLPGSSRRTDLSDIARRTRVLHALHTGASVITVASVRALMRTVPLDMGEHFKPIRFVQGEEFELQIVKERLIEMGYTRAEHAEEEGSFSVRGDTIDIYAPLSEQSVRVEFFGDEIESIKRLVPKSGQTIGVLEEVELYPICEVALNNETSARAVAALEKQAFLNPLVAYHSSLISEKIIFNELEEYLPVLSSRTGCAAELLPDYATTVVSEPRIMFDLSVRIYEEMSSATPGRELKGLVLQPAELTFGTGARLTIVSLLNASRAEFSITARRPDVAGSDERLTSATVTYLSSGYNVIVALPNRRIRERIETLFIGQGIPVGEGKGAVRMLDLDVVGGFVMPDAKLVVISQADAFPRALKRAAKRSDVDMTKLTFGFKPGDYVVHSTYGIALFKEMTKRTVDEVERDYLHLQYGGGDVLYTPVDQIDKITKYVGPDSGSPKITRLGTKSWSRATAKARASAKALAIDLTNLYARRSQVKGYAFAEDTIWQAEMEATFPFVETPDQLEAIADVKSDMESPRPMDRLICGDVGYGKTEVAIRATFKAVQEGKQVMVLCPTTILAQQHFATFTERLAPFGVTIEVLSRFRTAAQQRKSVESFSEGNVSVLIGTHRLLSKDISPKDLGLLVIDEEQRFGVEHKEKLKNMRENIDVLAMSATPIPRTLQMSLSGVRDMSVIDTPPANRHPVKVQVAQWDEEIVKHAIRVELARKGQVYYISNRVKTIEDAVRRVTESAPEARVGVAHGQMHERELEAVMESFVAGEIDVLVATTIVESGIDNPHSNTLIIEDSHRLGLSQLYQLKGRVGRSHMHAFAYFLYPPDSEMTPTAIERLMAIAEHDDLGSGIKIAMRDLEIRGAGSLLGADQSGQLSAVGFDLFASMIAEAVTQARGEETIAFPEIRVDLPDPAFLPEEYIEDIVERIRLYRRIAGLATSKGIDKLYQEMIAHYGAAPQAVENLFTLARIKVMCAQVGATAVTVSSKYIQVKISKPDDDSLQELKMIGALYDDQGRQIVWRIPYGESIVNAAKTLLGAILFDV